MTKKIIIATQAVILIAVGFLFYKSFTQKDKYEYKDDKKLAAKLSSDDIIVYYNQDTVVAKSLYIDSLKKYMESNFNARQAKLEGKKRRLEKWYEEQQVMVQKGLLSQGAQEKAYAEGMQQQQLLAQESEIDTREFNDLQMSIGQLIHDAIIKSTKELNKKRKIKFVLAYSESTNNVIPMDIAVDLTPDMVAIINDLYKSGKK